MLFSPNFQTRRLHESNTNFSTLGAHNLELMGKAYGVGPGEQTTGMSGTRTLFSIASLNKSHGNMEHAGRIKSRLVMRRITTL
jgi:hypothetical protein